MDALEQEVIEKFHQLDKAAQQRVREVILRATEPPAPFDYAAWFRRMEALRSEVQQRRGQELAAVDVVSILRDIRDSEDE
jgi:hypothetical protein